MRNPEFGTGGALLQDLSWLTREIGEEEMRLDNMTIAREAKYQAKNILHAGSDESQLYDYHNHTFISFLGEDGMHSDSQKYIINAFDIGEVRFAAGTEIRLRPGFESRRGSNFRAKLEVMNVCELTRDEIVGIFSAPFIQQDPLETKDIEKYDNSLILYPNPSNGSIVIEANSIQSVKIYTLEGKMLFSQNYSENSIVNIKTESNYNGIVIVETLTKNGVFRNKLILNK